MDTHFVYPILISFAISALIGPPVISYFRNLKMRQTERKEGVESHLKKAGTPTMGGVIFLTAILIVSLIYVRRYPRILPVLILTLGFGVIGFIDDYLKVILHRSDGLIAWQKLLLQIAVTAAFSFCMIRFYHMDLDMILPFSGGRTISAGILSIPLLFFVVIGTVNGTNFTDGLDGLASTVTLVVAIFFTIVAIVTGSGLEPISGALCGGLMGFLLYNSYPARIFMGDTGSLALGGFVAGMAYMHKMPLFILLVGIIYLIEVLSVMIQVSYFKATHGKRIFKMAPIHHHFELCGWSETRIVAVFAIVTAVMCLIAFIAM
ncbi:MAG: phospho-N-acetylmuramoyl-pentapeptide-transferase [Blautia sp.]|nr:phospho-N-acetylmuramoyl-pentapeptide-transferase [Blautia sp.]